MLEIDFETASLCNLKEAGAYEYSMHPSTEVLCVAWSVYGARMSWNCYEDTAKLAPLFELVKSGMTREAHNSFFEMCIWENVCVRKYGWPTVSRDTWRCSMAACAYKAIPLKLGLAAKGLNTDVQKDMEGNRLLMSITRPRVTWTPTKWGTKADPGTVERVTEYCVDDIGAEACVSRIVGPLPERELRLWRLDQRINMRGMAVDRELATHCNYLLKEGAHDAEAQMRDLTGGEVGGPTDTNALKLWLANAGVPLPTTPKGALSLPATFIENYLEQPHVEGAVRDVLDLRRCYGKSSTSKITKLLACSETDGRARGLLQYHGATTGRWAGRLIQPQNMPRPSFYVDADLLKSMDYAQAKAFYGPVHVAVSNVLRQCFWAGEGNLLTAGDFSGIESVCLAWLFSEDWKLDMFRKQHADERAGKKDIVDNYCTFAEKVFGYPCNKRDNKKERQTGKIGELAFGYQGGVGAWRNFDRSDQYTDAEVDVFKNLWREQHAKVVEGWRNYNFGFIRAIHDRCNVDVGRVTFGVDGDWAFCRLPDNSRIWYRNPRLESHPVPWNEDDWRATAVFDAYKSTKSGGKIWGPIRAYGGLLTENIDQAVCRNLMADKMEMAEEAGLPIVLTVHDELVTEHPEGDASAGERLQELMETPPAWAPDWPIAAEVWTGRRYRK